MPRRERGEVGLFWRCVIFKINEISDMSELEFIKIVTSMEIMANKTFQCQYCLEKSKQPRRDALGCTVAVDKPLPIVHYSKRIEFKRCPGNFYDQTVESLLYIHDRYMSGILPFGGSLMDQPNKFIQIMQTIDETQSRMALEAQKKVKHGR